MTNESKDKKLLDRAHDAWSSLAHFRARRRRAKDFTFGRQWGDTVRLPTGRIITEERQLLDSGRIPVSNNLIRQLVKSIVGRRRYLKRRDESQEGKEFLDSLGSSLSPLPFEETDSRCFEEFLISGCAAQRLGGDGLQPEPCVAVSPQRLLFSRFERSDASDCRLIGMLHDMPPARVLTLFGTDRRRRSRILDAYGRARRRDATPPLTETDTDFFTPDSPGAWRVIEIWSREIVSWEEEVAEGWTVTFLAPNGDVLSRRSVAAEETPPFVLALYPMIDGEVHSFVDDLIEQQKYVNRLIMMLDDVMRASAKGIVMFPVDQLPEGMTWSDVRRLWAEPGAILPFKRTSKNIMPYQMQNSGTSAGAAHLLKIQLDMFDEISGSTSGTRGGQSHAAGAEMLRQEFEQATVAIYDLMQSFDSFIARRNSRLEVRG